MMRLVTVLAAVTLASANPVSNIFEIDISPEEAAKYLNSPPFTQPELSGRTAVLPLVRWDSPQFRAAEAGPTLGHYWKNGKEIENTNDYDEEVYNAAQYHGQDGLGAYAYGYQGPDSSKVENRQRSGDLQGSYTYRDGNNELIKVRYWADGEGFHQEDNLPKVVLQPVQEADDVREARLAHEKAWQEAAAAAAQQPDPQGAYSANYDYHAAASEPEGVVASAPGQGPREGKAYSPGQNYQASQQFGQQKQYGQQAGQYGQQSGQLGQQSGQFGQQPGQYSQQSAQSSGQYGQQQQFQGKPEEPEPTGPPRGFFYSYDYPVSIIVAKNAGQGGPVHPGTPVDHDTVGINAQRG